MTNYTIYNSEAEVTPVAHNLWAVSNCFDQSTFDWLSRLHLSNDAFWNRHKDCLEYRLEMTPTSPAFDKVSEIGVGMTKNMEKIVGHELTTAGTKVWLDVSDFHCPAHHDAELLLVTYQVYLWCWGGYVPGTTFSHVDPAVTIPFGPNTGYINLNVDQKMHQALPRSDGSRLSVCFQWRSLH